MWNGQLNVLATDYDRYFIYKLCPFKSNKRKYVPCECFKFMTKWYIMNASPIPYNLTTYFEWVSVNPPVRSFSHMYRKAVLRIEGFWKFW